MHNFHRLPPTERHAESPYSMVSGALLPAIITSWGITVVSFTLPYLQIGGNDNIVNSSLNCAAQSILLCSIMLNHFEYNRLLMKLEGNPRAYIINPSRLLEHDINNTVLKTHKKFVGAWVWLSALLAGVTMYLDCQAETSLPHRLALVGIATLLYHLRPNAMVAISPVQIEAPVNPAP